MKNIYYSIIVLLFTIASFGQVGVNINIPLQPFHVDPKKDTNSSATPAINTTDDFVVTTNGSVGIGTVNPTAKLEVNGNLKLVDGTQAKDRVMMSDKDGNAQWRELAAVTPTVLGTFETATLKCDANSPTYLDPKISITLPKGKWIVNLGLTIDNQTDYSMWLHANLSSSRTTKEVVGFKLFGKAGNNTSYASSINGKLAYNTAVSTKSAFGLLSGSMLIEVTDPTVTLYILLEKLGVWSYGSGSWENYLYAIPIM